MRKRLFIVLLFLTPIFFFFGLRLLRFIMGTDYQETITKEIVEALIYGYTVSLGLWYHYRKGNLGVEKNRLAR